MPKLGSLIHSLAITIGVALLAAGLTGFASGVRMEDQRSIQETEIVLEVVEPEPVSLSGESGFYEPESPEQLPLTEGTAVPEGKTRKTPGKVDLPPPQVTGIDALLEPEIPVRILIPSISLDAEIIPAASERVMLAGQEFTRWLAPDEEAVGWHTASAPLGEPGNTVLNGHHNVFGSVFARLSEVEVGDLITVRSQSRFFTYKVTNVMILPEKYEPLDVRLSNAAWIQRSTDERLTLITCWPPETNTHRVIVVAAPIN